MFEGPGTDDLHFISGKVHFNQEALDLHAARWSQQIDANLTIPEPSSLAMLTIGGGLALLRRRRKSRIPLSQAPIPQAPPTGETGK